MAPRLCELDWFFSLCDVRSFLSPWHPSSVTQNSSRPVWPRFCSWIEQGVVHTSVNSSTGCLVSMSTFTLSQGIWHPLRNSAVRRELWGISHPLPTGWLRMQPWKTIQNSLLPGKMIHSFPLLRIKKTEFYFSLIKLLFVTNIRKYPIRLTPSGIGLCSHWREFFHNWILTVGVAAPTRAPSSISFGTVLYADLFGALRDNADDQTKKWSYWEELKSQYKSCN